MRVSDVMVKNPVTISPTMPVLEVARLMKEKEISSVILTSGSKPVGIVTERDLVRRVLAEAKDPHRLQAADICSKPIVAVSIYCPLEDAVETMNEHAIRRLVVVDDKDMLVGIITTDDIGYNLKSMSEELAMKYLSLTKRK